MYDFLFVSFNLIHLIKLNKIDFIVKNDAYFFSIKELLICFCHFLILWQLFLNKLITYRFYCFHLLMFEGCEVIFIFFWLSLDLVRHILEPLFHIGPILMRNVLLIDFFSQQANLSFSCFVTRVTFFLHLFA